MQLNEFDFSSLDVHEIGAWPLVLRAAVTIVVCIVSVLLVYFFILAASLDSLALQKTQLENKRKDFKEKYNMAINLDAYKKQMQDMQTTYTDLLRELPATSDIPSLVDNISKVGDANNIKITAIKIGDPQSPGGFYMELPISFTLIGAYHNIGKFISQILQLPRIITIGDFSLRRVEGSDSSDSAKKLLQMSLETRTYWLSNNNDKTDANPQPATLPATHPNASAEPSAMPHANPQLEKEGG